MLGKYDTEWDAFPFEYKSFFLENVKNQGLMKTLPLYLQVEITMLSFSFSSNAIDLLNYIYYVCKIIKTKDINDDSGKITIQILFGNNSNRDPNMCVTFKENEFGSIYATNKEDILSMFLNVFAFNYKSLYSSFKSTCELFL
jgi:hypothetical protein